MTAKTPEEVKERMVAQRFRKKPVVIEAWPFDGSWASAEPIVALASHLRWSFCGNGGVLYIDTLEGTMEALAGDWIIKGTKGEFYPCKPAVFADVYEPEDAADSAGWPQSLIDKARAQAIEECAKVARKIQEQENRNTLTDVTSNVDLHVHRLIRFKTAQQIEESIRALSTSPKATP